MKRLCVVLLGLLTQWAEGSITTTPSADTCSTRITDGCSSKGGFCIIEPLQENCGNGTLKERACTSKHCQCCIPVSQPSCDGKMTNKCKKKGGTCVMAPFKANCDGKLSKRACKSKDCQCCIPIKAPTCQGKITNGCTKKGGSCVLAPFEDNCKAGKLSAKACKGKDCQCCVPEKAPSCDGKLLNSCIKKGGHCVLAPFQDNCRGKLIERACSGASCQCCIPDPTVAPTLNPTQPPTPAPTKVQTKSATKPPATQAPTQPHTTPRHPTQPQTNAATKLPTTPAPPKPTTVDQTTPAPPKSTTNDQTTPAPPKPTTATPPKPITAAQPKPTSTAAPPKPTTATPPKPTTAAPPKPTTAAPSKPTTADPPKPTTATPSKPSTADPPKPKTATPPKPTTAVPPQPTTAPPPKPTTVDPQTPAPPKPAPPKPTTAAPTTLPPPPKQTTAAPTTLPPPPLPTTAVPTTLPPPPPPTTAIPTTLPPPPPPTTAAPTTLPPPPKPTAPAPPACPQDFSLRGLKGGKCLYVNTADTLKWEDARDACTDRDARLIEPNDVNEFKTFADRNYNGKQFWMGATDSESEGTWVWSSGEPVPTGFPWGSGQPDNSWGEDCLMYPYKDGFNDNDCGSKLHYICEACPTGYAHVGSQCLSFNTEEQLNWQDASDKCQAKGDSLAVIKNFDALQTYIGDNYGGSGRAYFWLGGTKSQAQVTWRNDYRCGSTFPLANGAPSICNPTGGLSCCSPHNWCGNTDNHCTCNNCKDYDGSPLTRYYGPRPKIWDDSQCAVVGIHTDKSLTECKDKCDVTAGCTAMNFNGNDNVCVLRECTLPVPEPAWDYSPYVGYSKVSSEWVWVNGGDMGVSAIPWGPNEPNNSGGAEDCFDFITGHGYNDDQCNRERYFVCNKGT